jgi:hypothetical protein
VVFVAAFRRIRPEVLGPLLADCAGDSELRAAFMSTLFDPPRAAARKTLDRAQARGDLRDDADLDLLLDLIAAFVHYRALFGHAPTSDAEIERAVEALLRGIATDYPRLLDHSRRPGRSRREAAPGGPSPRRSLRRWAGAAGEGAGRSLGERVRPCGAALITPPHSVLG